MTSNEELALQKRRVKWMGLLSVAGISFGIFMTVLLFTLPPSRVSNERGYAEFALEALFCEQQLDGREIVASDIEAWNAQGGIYQGDVICVTQEDGRIHRYHVTHNAITGENNSTKTN